MLTDEKILAHAGAVFPFSMFPKALEFGRDIESAAAAPLLEQLDNASKEIARIRSESATQSERIAELEQEVQRFQSDAVNEKAARQELERQLEQAREDAINQAAGRARATIVIQGESLESFREAIACRIDDLAKPTGAAIQAEVKP